MAYKKSYQFWITIVLVLIGCLFNLQPAEALDKEKVIFEMTDPVGDDRGPGTYTYPKSSIFDPKRQLFDLTNFRVSIKPNTYLFDFTMGKLTNPWGATEGFSHPIFEVYIDTAPGKGRTETLREGAFVNFSAEHGWEYLVKVVGWGNTAVFEYTDPHNSKGIRKDIKVGVLSDKLTVRVEVPRALLEGNPANWHYYVLVGSQDGLGPDNFRMVMEKAAAWQFGGGTDTNYDPNVIDLLAPKEGNKTQYKQLSSYNVAKGNMAELYPVSPTAGEKVIADRQTTWVRAVYDFIEVITDPVLNKYPVQTYYPGYALVGIIILIILLLGWVNFGSYFKGKE